jgi:hypothetical protein
LSNIAHAEAKNCLRKNLLFSDKEAINRYIDSVLIELTRVINVAKGELNGLIGKSTDDITMDDVSSMENSLSYMSNAKEALKELKTSEEIKPKISKLIREIDILVKISLPMLKRVITQRGATIKKTGRKKDIQKTPISNLLTAINQEMLNVEQAARALHQAI